MIYGYARCSTNESKQDINRQVRELKAAGAEEVYFEYEHGDSAVKQKQLALFDIVREGDTIITLEVPRLARSTKQLCEIIELVKEKKIKLVIVGSVTVDCTQGRLDPMSNAFIQMSGVFAELELGMIRERVRSGMANGYGCILTKHKHGHRLTYNVTSAENHTLLAFHLNTGTLKKLNYTCRRTGYKALSADT